MKLLKYIYKFWKNKSLRFSKNFSSIKKTAAFQFSYDINKAKFF